MPRDPNIPDAFDVSTLVMAEAARLSDGDPSVHTGRLTYDLMESWVAAGSLAFPAAEQPVGQRRSMPDD